VILRRHAGRIVSCRRGARCARCARRTRCSATTHGGELGVIDRARALSTDIEWRGATGGALQPDGAGSQRTPLRRPATAGRGVHGATRRAVTPQNSCSKRGHEGLRRGAGIRRPGMPDRRKTLAPFDTLAASYERKLGWKSCSRARRPMTLCSYARIRSVSLRPTSYLLVILAARALLNSEVRKRECRALKVS
jgi:hypothetical protein